MKILVTSGGTRVAIDSVRSITNFSNGTTGMLIATEALNQGHEVIYICSKNAKVPAESSSLKVIKIDTFDDYHRSLNNIFGSEKIDVAIMAMAASDYTPVDFPVVEGKADLTKKPMYFRKLPKLIEKIKQWSPTTILVGFKLLANETCNEHDLVEEAYQLLISSKCNYVVANLVNSSFKPTYTALVNVEKYVTKVDRAELPKVLLDRIQQRYVEAGFLPTDVFVDSDTQEIPKELIYSVKYLDALGLFPKYQENANNTGQFGFLAARSNDRKSMFITKRGGTKGKTGESEFVNVLLNDDNENVVSYGEKPSLNAGLARALFNKYKNVNYIFHAHFQLPGVYTSKKSTHPGTKKDNCVLDELPESIPNIFAFNQFEHGCYILISDSQLDRSVVNFLREHNVYNANGRAYNMLYSRFIDNFKILDIAESCRGIDSKGSVRVLDFCGGTGAVSTEWLKRHPNSNIVLAENSFQMSSQCIPDDRIKIVSGVSNITETNFDYIICRQCLNYFDPILWNTILKELYAKLNKGGVLVLNTFRHMKEGKTKSYYLNKNGVSGFYEEHTNIEYGYIDHVQKVQLYQPESRVYFDLNTFWNTPKVFNIEVSRHNTAIITEEGNSIYGVIIK